MGHHPHPLPVFPLDSTLSGLDLLHRWIELGYVAGLNGTLCSRPVEAEFGRVVFTCRPDGRHMNFVGLVHGGVAAGLVDIVGGAAAMSCLKPGETLLTTDLNVRFLKPAFPDRGDMIAEGRTIYRDDRKMVAEVTVRIGEEIVVAGNVGISIRPPARGG